VKEKRREKETETQNNCDGKFWRKKTDKHRKRINIKL